jgi:hypothetical protein
MVCISCEFRVKMVWKHLAKNSLFLINKLFCFFEFLSWLVLNERLGISEPFLLMDGDFIHETFRCYNIYSLTTFPLLSFLLNNLLLIFEDICNALATNMFQKY